MPTTVTRDQIEQRVYAALEVFGVEPEELSHDARFELLDVDSLDLVELAQIVDEEYGVVLRGEDMKNLATVGQAIELIAAKAK